MLVFITTFASPHTIPFAVEAKKYYDRVVFINTMQITEERRRMGYGKSGEGVEFLDLHDNVEECKKLISLARDVILSCPLFELVEERISKGGSVYLAYERIFKKGIIKLADPRTWKIASFCRRVRDKNVYLLAIGDFSAKDFRTLGFNKDKIFRFGYFPNTSSLQECVKERCTDKCHVLWVGRMVGFKRPLVALKAFRRLPSFYELTMVGDGKLFSKAISYKEKKKIDNVKMLGNVPNDKVLELMRSSDILLSTSTKGEGWGAVVNEGMSCGCAVVSSDTIGCAGTLVTQDNAVLYKTHSIGDLVRAIKEASPRCCELGRLGEMTIRTHFNASVAAERFASIAKTDDKELFANGLCSKVF